MKHFKILALVLAVCLNLNLCVFASGDEDLINERVINLDSSTVTVDQYPNTFSVSGWAKAEFAQALSYGLVPSGQVLQNHTNDINRLYFCMLAVNLYNKITGTQYKSTMVNNPFTDTTYLDVKIAYELKIVSGTSESTFSPNDLITREQAAKMLTAALVAASSVLEHKSDAGTKAVNALSDKDDLSDWAKEYVGFMISKGYMLGVTESEFDPKGLLTWEQAVMISKRLLEKNMTAKSIKPNAIRITAPKDGTVLKNEGVKVTWERDTDVKDGYTVMVVKAGQNTGGFTQQATENFVNIPASAFQRSGDYAILVIANSGYSSIPVKVTSGEPAKPFVDPLRIYVKGYNGTISWTGKENSVAYNVKIQEDRPGDLSVIGNGPLHEFTLTENALNFTFEKPRIYTVTVESMDKDAVVLDSVSKEFGTGGYQYNSRQKFFGDKPITTKEEADAQMKTFNVNVWKVDKNGKLYASTYPVTVHQKLEHIVWQTFQAIFEHPDKFPIKSISSYDWRTPKSSGSFSEHNYGTALDINYNENYCVYSNGTVVGSFWKPYENIYSINPYGSTITIFERNGFTWGGDAWSTPKDYMHFSYLGT